MVDLADVRLDRPDRPRDSGPARRGARLTAAALIVVVLALTAGYFVWLRRTTERPSVRVQSERVPAASQRLPAEGPADIVVPPLGETDPLVRKLVAELSSHPTVAAWLTTDHLIRNFALVIQSIAEHRTPAGHLKVVKPTGAFAVTSDGVSLYVDPASYHRYDAAADAFTAIDARGAARLYATLKPRINEAYHELGDPDGDFDATLRRAIVELLGTPVIDTRIALTSKGGTNYAFQDPALEGLSPAQRQLLRMGPRNIRLVQQKLREIAPYLGIDVSAGASR